MANPEHEHWTYTLPGGYTSPFYSPTFEFAVASAFLTHREVQEVHVFSPSGGGVDVTLEEAAAMGVLSPADKDEWVIQAPSSVGWTPDEMAQIGRAVQAFQAGLPGLYRPIRLEATVLPDDGNARADG